MLDDRAFVTGWWGVVAAATLLLLVAFVRSGVADTFTDPGFAAETIATLDQFTPVGLAFAPDGRIFVWQKHGVVRIVKNGSLLEAPFIDISSQVNTHEDRGLLGLALDPNFATNGFVYLLYTKVNASGDPDDIGPTTAQLTRVKASGDIASPTDPEVVLLGGIPSTSTSHTIGTVRFAPDGTLFVGSGDGSRYDIVDPDALRAQNLDSPNGKIFRLNPDGSAAQDNPFSGPAGSIRSKVWAYGLRNPFRFSLHPVSGEPVIGDVGWNDWEEINTTGRGKNFGWPCFEGEGPQPEYQAAGFNECQDLQPGDVMPPLYAYHHTDPDAFGVTGATVIAGPVYTGSAYPAQYHGNLFIADYTDQWIKRLVFDANGQLVNVLPFAENVDGPVAIEQGPDGFLYYVALLSGEIRRIRFNGAVAEASANPTFGPLGPSGLTVNFFSTGSRALNGGTLSYSWAFGDGATSTEANPTHKYNSAGSFTATLTVSAGIGAASSDSVVITVGSTPPLPTIAAPQNGLIVFPGQAITYQGSATDLEDGSLGASALSWIVLLHHNTHVHIVESTTGAQGSFGVTDHGQGVFSYEIILTARDSSGLTETTSVLLPANPSHLPVPAALTFGPNPVAGGTFAVGTVTLSMAAPAGGAMVALSSDTSAVAVPAFVTVPATKKTATFNAATSKVVSDRTAATITATLNGSLQAVLTVDPPTTTTTTALNYLNRAALVSGGWTFLARTATGEPRNTEQTSGRVVSYTSGFIRIPADHGDLWSDLNDSRNTLFRNLPADWISIRMKVANFAPTENWQTACLGAYQDDDNFLVSCRDFIEEPLFESWHESGGSPAILDKVPATATSNFFLRIDRDRVAEALTAFFSPDNGVSWTRLGASVIKPMTNPRLAIFVGANAPSSTTFPNAEIASVDVVTMPAIPTPTVVASPAALAFLATAGGSNPAARNVSITNGSGGSLPWLVSANQPWVTVTPGFGGAPATLSVKVVTTGLLPGTHLATVTITSPGASNSPATVPVTLTVAPPAGARPVIFGICRFGAPGPCGGRR